MLKILIADDHAVVRVGLGQFLAGVPDCQIAGEAGSGQETLALIREGDWGLLLLDLCLPDLNGIEVLKQVKREKPGLPVLIFSMYAEDDYAMAALEAGATGYLPKDSPPDEILAAILRAGRGERYLSPSLTEKLLAGTTHAGLKQPHDALSEREAQVMVLLSRGLSLNAIGGALFLSPKTVSTYRARVLDKLNLRSNADLTRYVIEHQLDAQGGSDSPPP